MYHQSRITTKETATMAAWGGSAQHGGDMAAVAGAGEADADGGDGVAAGGDDQQAAAEVAGAADGS
jgi:hypothetical protein